MSISKGWSLSIFGAAILGVRPCGPLALRPKKLDTRHRLSFDLSTMRCGIKSSRREVQGDRRSNFLRWPAFGPSGSNARARVGRVWLSGAFSCMVPFPFGPWRLLLVSRCVRAHSLYANTLLQTLPFWNASSRLAFRADRRRCRKAHSWSHIVTGLLVLRRKNPR